jgi:hypothetical protein
MLFSSFTELENSRVEQVLARWCFGGRLWGRTWEGEYGANTVYTCM